MVRIRMYDVLCGQKKIDHFSLLNRDLENLLMDEGPSVRRATT